LLGPALLLLFLQPLGLLELLALLYRHVLHSDQGSML
jgi:hypothetical protein